jgi:hypothetical protein
MIHAFLPTFQTSNQDVHSNQRDTASRYTLQIEAQCVPNHMHCRAKYTTAVVTADKRARLQKITRAGETSTYSAASQKVGHSNVGGHHNVDGAIGSGSDQLSTSCGHNRQLS